MFGHMPQGDEIRNAEESENRHKQDVFPRNDQIVEMIEKDVITNVIKEMEGDGDDRGIKEHRKVAAPRGDQKDESLLHAGNL